FRVVFIGIQTIGNPKNSKHQSCYTTNNKGSCEHFRLLISPSVIVVLFLSKGRTTNSRGRLWANRWFWFDVCWLCCLLLWLGLRFWLLVLDLKSRRFLLWPSIRFFSSIFYWDSFRFRSRCFSLLR